MDTFIGRQPIFNIYEQVVAYELLYRSTNSNAFTMTDADGATVDVLVNFFLNIGIDEVTKGKPGFVNFTENLLLSSVVDYLNPRQVVIEILEDVPMTPEVIESVKNLKASGFQIALDDFVLNDNFHIYDELFHHIDFIKVDFLLSPLHKCIEIERRVKVKFPHIKLLAEKVETREHLEVAKQSGYELFQGYFFEKPQVIQAKEIPESTVQYFQILSLLKEEEPDVDAIAEIIARDLSLSYKLLQLLNSTYKRSLSPVHSIKQAIVMVGLIELRKWIYLLAMRDSNKPVRDVFFELMRTSLFRAKVCEILAKHTRKVKYSECFLVGMFSLIDSLLQKPMDYIVEHLPFSEAVSDTILGKTTSMTPYLQCSVALGKMEWTKAKYMLQQMGAENIDVDALFNEAFNWSEEAIQSFG